MDEQLFNEFNPVVSKQWKQLIQYELKGADYNETLVWQSPEGIGVKPFYHADEAAQPLAATATKPGFFIGQDIFVQDVEKSANRAAGLLQRGAEAIHFTIADATVNAEALVSQLPAATLVYFYLRFTSIDFVKKLNAIAQAKGYTFYVLQDPVGYLAKEGNWAQGGDNFEVLTKTIEACPDISCVSIDGALYQNAGANMVQHLAYMLAHANEYFNRIAIHKKSLVFQVAVGGNYFFEIAKLRALRVLYSALAKEYSLPTDCHIIARPTRRNKTLYDYNVNMLRTSTECMAAVLGGANTVINLPYDALYHKSNEFGERIARNQLLILKHESYFDKVANPADGAYYIEELTNQLAEKALALFKEIEAAGGFVAKLMDGTIQRKIHESAEKEQLLFNEGKEVLIGTNKYPNKADRMSHDLELYPFVKAKPRKTLITPVIEKRLAEKVEQERLDAEIQPAAQ
ncbi:methylmalonyl-CoA mutase [Flavobacterium akiainvivens]|uniref:Methylmalonyl-CoA mutase n=1 Tax=Flavobacterium akiainvivens TaxID=1202724 RepID=A0A0M8MEK7_9FLAO|nr:methylmalonyl-CoA mutase subunit beta [Flavobacterium akiainvivens]KOS04641.1 methylmalonyl-CoA mutase [Flavobacterium akiainvivens]SFQ65557.1 heterodimeric methylmalonyl-CoA mutase small subunit [Flavobacterium akiainvivens]